MTWRPVVGITCVDRRTSYGYWASGADNAAYIGTAAANVTTAASAASRAGTGARQGPAARQGLGRVQGQQRWSRNSLEQEHGPSGVLPGKCLNIDALRGNLLQFEFAYVKTRLCPRHS